MKVKIKKLYEDSVLPTKAHPADAGFDLYANSVKYDYYGNVVYGTGIAMEIPDGYVGLIFPRSSICKQTVSLSNAVGVCDSSYRGEIMCKFKPTAEFVQDTYLGGVIVTGRSHEYRHYEVGDRIAQLIIIPYPEIEFEEVAELSETERGTGGYGSTGR